MEFIHKLAAQYFQLVELNHLDLPPGSVLVRPEVQAALYEHMFDETIFPIPPHSYRSRVLKQILSRIEESITDPEQDVCNKLFQVAIHSPINHSNIIYITIHILFNLITLTCARKSMMI